jgi:HAMP domain-containing protein
VKPLFGGLLVRLFASVILPFSLVLFGLAVAAIDIHGKAMRQLVADRDERSARAAAAAISQELYHRQVTLRQIALRLGDGVSPSRAVAEADIAARDFTEGIAAIAGDGRSAAGAMPAVVSGSSALRKALASPGSERLFYPLTTAVGTIVLAASRGGSFTVVGAFTLSDLLHLALPGLEASSGRVSGIIVDQASVLISAVGAPPLELDYGNHPGVRAALQGSSGSSFTVSAAGEEHVLAYSPIPAAGWALLIEEPWRSVASPLLRLSLVAPLALVPALAIALLGLWLAGRQVVLPLRELQRNSLKLAGGDFSAVDEDAGGVQEIQELQRSMRTMARRLQSAQQSLQRYIGRVTTAQEEERRRLAQDLHDETIQDLIALDQKVQLAGRILRAGKGFRAAGLEDIHREAKDAIQRVRRLTRALRPAYLEDLGLLAALEALARDVLARFDCRPLRGNTGSPFERGRSGGVQNRPGSPVECVPTCGGPPRLGDSTIPSRGDPGHRAG